MVEVISSDLEKSFTNNELGMYFLMGVFTKENIMSLNHKLYDAFNTCAPVEINLEGVIHCDSAFIASLIEYKHYYPKVTYTNIPLAIRQLLLVYNVTNLI